jgi:hypothetical protein
VPPNPSLKSGPPTGWHLGREASSVIIRLAAQAPARWCPLSSNVRPQRARAQRAKPLHFDPASQHQPLLMRDDHLGFSYKWTDLAPVRGLVAFVVVFQVVGLVAGALLPRFPSTYDSAWFGAAVATLPAFLVGLVLQLKLNRANITGNKRMVWHIGLVATALSVFALAMPLLGFGD